MKHQELFKEAIADANSLRKAALANAKRTIEEELTPKIESMLDKKLAEMEDKDIAEAEEKNENAFMQPTVPQGPTNTAIKPNGTMEEELEAILKELGMEDQVDESTDDITNESDDIDEVEDDSAPATDDADMDVDADDDMGSEDDMGGEESSDDQAVTELTVGELTSLIQTAVQAAVGGGEMDADAGMDDMGADAGMDPGMDGASAEDSLEDDGMSEEIDLDELLSELNDDDVNEGSEEDVNESSDDDVNESEEDIKEAAKDDLKEAKQWYDKKVKGGRKAMSEDKAWYNVKAKRAKKMSESGSLVKPLNRNAKNLAPGKGLKKESGSLVKPLNRNAKNIAPGKGLKKESSNKELNEAVKVIKKLKETLNETNLLNSKLLYANKLFKAKSLNESQKVKVIAAIDKARNKEEAKTIFESLYETLGSKKQQIKESLGFASKPISGTGAPKKVIVEDAQVARFQKLAGIIKK